MSEPVFKPRDVPRIAPGTRVDFTTGKFWWHVGKGYELRPQAEWDEPLLGTVLEPEQHRGWRYGPDHAWGVRDWETVVMLDEPMNAWGTRLVKYPTSMLDVVDTPAPAPLLVQDAFAF